jgi:superfamily II DNA or RNA helicase
MKANQSVMATDAAPKETTRIPPKYWFSKKLGNNRVTELKYASFTFQGQLSPGESFDLRGEKVFVSDKRIAHTPDGYDDLLFLTKSQGPEWLKKSEISEPKWDVVIERRAIACDSLLGKFKFVEEQRDVDRRIKVPGLRPPQIGAVYTSLGHWKTTTEIATVVMPTGTGKTDAMIALMALEQPSCLLVVVPTDALRTQLAEKFLTLGLLLDFGILPPGTTYPVVGVLKSGFKNTTEIKTFCDACNVIVTTMPLLATFSDLHQNALASLCSHLFIDEAHHVRAVTWNRLRERFRGKPVLQFTATPYRNDGQHVDGKIIFNYPLRKAQQEGYFQKITLKELWDYVEPDEAIAKAAIEQLNVDLAHGFDHIVMARAANIAKAETLQSAYDRYGHDFCPVVVHSNLSQKELNARMDQLATRKSRVAICVAMFGEGFDLPQLKIAALHDIHQSLAVTIQFTGRFTRSNANVGNATIIVNRSDVEVNDSVRELYAQGEGADWNHVLTKLTEGATENQICKETFYQSFNADSPFVPIQNITPKMSTVVYQATSAKWAPWKVKESSFAAQIQ